MLFQRLADDLLVELIAGIGRKHAGALGIDDHYVRRHAAGLDIGLDRIVGQREISRQQHRCIVARLADRIDLRLDLDGLLRIGVDIHDRRQDRQHGIFFRGLYHDDARILAEQRNGLSRLLIRTALNR